MNDGELITPAPRYKAPKHLSKLQRDAYDKGWTSGKRGSDQWTGSSLYAKKHRGAADTSAWRWGWEDAAKGRPKWATPVRHAAQAAQMQEGKLL